MKEKLTIIDFKLFEKQDITLNNLTVLAGSNSVGKSTVIQSLLLLRTVWNESKKYAKETLHYRIPLNGPFNLEMGNTHEVIRRGKRIAESFVHFALYDIGNEVIMDVTLSGDRANNTVYELLVENVKTNVKHGGGILSENFYYLCAERIGPRLKYEHEILEYLHVGYKGENTFQILSGENVEVSIDKLFKKEEPALLFDQARKWLDYIIPGASFDNAVAMGKSKVIEGTFSESLPTNVGFGISYVLPIIVNGLLVGKDNYFIVENPEAHLHPSGQSRIGRFLAQIAGTGVKVIIETHSEHVINGIRISTQEKLLASNAVIINYFSKNDSETSMVKEIDLTTSGDLTMYPKGFFDQEQKDITEIIESRIK